MINEYCTAKLSINRSIPELSHSITLRPNYHLKPHQHGTLIGILHLPIYCLHLNNKTETELTQFGRLLIQPMSITPYAFSILAIAVHYPY